MESRLQSAARFFFILPSLFVMGMSIPTDYPFSPGERLIYKVRWGIFPAGTVTFEVKPVTRVNQVLCYHFVMTAETNAFVDKFFKVRDRYESFIDLSMRNSLLFKKKQYEGKLRTDIIVTFDWEKQTSMYSNFGKNHQTRFILPETCDPLSFFYKLRLQELRVNQQYNISVADGEESFLGTVRVTKKRKIRTRLGKYSAYLVEPDMDSYGWIFRQTPDTKLKVWFSSDANKLPVKFSTKVTFGGFSCELVAINNQRKYRVE